MLSSALQPASLTCATSLATHMHLIVTTVPLVPLPLQAHSFSAAKRKADELRVELSSYEAPTFEQPQLPRGEPAEPAGATLAAPPGDAEMAEGPEADSGAVEEEPGQELAGSQGLPPTEVMVFGCGGTADDADSAGTEGSGGDGELLRGQVGWWPAWWCGQLQAAPMGAAALASAAPHAPILVC
jgi:hypothetical protein